MAYDLNLASKLRDYLKQRPGINVEEKPLFGGLAFLVNGKMCLNVSNTHLMCRFHPDLHETVAGKPGFTPLFMRGKEIKGYCYVHPQGLTTKKELDYWIDLCLSFNEKVKLSRKK